MIYIWQILRNILRNRINSVIIITSLTIGMFTAFIILPWALFEHSFDRFHTNKDRIYRVINHQSNQGQHELYLASIPEYMVNTFENEIPGIELSTALVYAGSFRVTKGESLVEIGNVYYSDNNLFQIFSFNHSAGDPKTSLAEPYLAVITKETAIKLFGEEDPIGKTIESNNSQDYVVSGVIDDVPANSHLQFDMLLSMEERKPNWDTDNGNHNASIYVLMNEHVNVEDLKPNLRQHTDKHLPWNQGFHEFQLQPMLDLHLNSKHTIWEINRNKFDGKYVGILLLITLLILLISSINFINLSLLNLSRRNIEIGIKKAFGYGHFLMSRQFVLEFGILAGLSSLLAIVLVSLAFPSLQNTFFNGYAVNEVYTWSRSVVCLAIIFFMVIFIGMYPALRFASHSPLKIMLSRLTDSGKGISRRKTLVIAQLAFTTFLIIAALVILKQMNFIRHKDLGVNTDQVITLSTNAEIRENYKVIKEELLSNPQIESVSASSCVFGNNFWRNIMYFEGQLEDSRYEVPYLITDFNFVEFYSMEILQGRAFSEEYATDKEGLGFIINEALALEMGFDDPLGKKMRFGHTENGEIIGVVRDFHYQSLHKQIEPMAFYTGEGELYELQVKVNPELIDEALSILETTWKTYMPDRPFRYQFMDERFASLYQKEGRTVKLVLVLCILSILLSSLGLFGLVSFVAEGKTKEIGIRKSNGASILDVVLLLSKSFIIWAFVAWILITPVSWYVMTRWLEDFASRTAMSWWIFIVAGVTSLLVAAITVGWQSWRAARKNPIDALRYE